MLSTINTAAYTTVIPTYAIIAWAVWGAIVIAIHLYLYVHYVKTKRSPTSGSNARSGA